MTTTVRVGIRHQSAGHRDTVAHATEDEYGRVIRPSFKSEATFEHAMRRYRAFVTRYPTMDDWLAEPLEERLGKLRGEGRTPSRMTNPVAYYARQYIQFMALSGRVQLPWDYLLMLDLRGVGNIAEALGHDWYPDYVEALIAQSTALDWSRSAAQQAISFCLPRFALRHGNIEIVKHLSADDFARLRSEITDVYAAVNPMCNTRWKRENRRMGRGALSAAFACWAIHHQLGLVLDGPKQTRRDDQRAIVPTVAEEIQAGVDAWQNWDAARGTPKKSLVNHNLYIRYFLAFVEDKHPELKRLDQLKRHHVVGYIEWLRARPTVKGDGFLSAETRNASLSSLAAMLAALRDEELGPAPVRTLVHSNDYAKVGKRLPRNIPKKELDAVATAMRQLADPYQRCALLVARWSGARRDEIARLETDCLDTYDDGTYRLRIPAGKTNKERSIPLADEAAEAIQAVQLLRGGDRDLGTVDPRTQRRTRFLFMRRGRRLSHSFLFDTALQKCCEQAGLVKVDGKGKVITAHRFRHTLGTNLVEQGARWRTIMAILGHETSDMTMTYAQVSDPEVKADYEKVVSNGTAIAGPAAESILTNRLPQPELDWLKTNFFKTELELGACVRLPEEGPCECELFFICSKFFTTKEHAPRLRRRWEREQWLVEDAQVRGWAREVERHRATQKRIEDLLQDLGEKVEANVEPVDHRP